MVRVTSSDLSCRNDFTNGQFSSLLGHMARLTINLPSGRSQTYGSLPTSQQSNPPTAGISHRSYPTAKEAKRAIAMHAMNAGVVDLIFSEDVLVEAVTPAPGLVAAPEALASTSRIQALLPSYLGLSSYVAFDPETAAPPTAVPGSSKPVPAQRRPETRPTKHPLPAKPSFLLFEPPNASRSDYINSNPQTLPGIYRTNLILCDRS
jgi:hypothetical protein